MTLLSVKDLRIDLAMGDTSYEAVDKVSFDIARGETFGWSASPAAASRSRRSPSWACCSGRSRSAADRSRSTAARSIEADEDEMRRLRGKRLAMIFQEPMTALNPLLPVGRQIAEMFILHEGASWRDAAAPRHRGADARARSRRRSGARATIRTSSPAACASA